MILGQSKKNRISIEDINKSIPKDSLLKAIKHLPGTVPMPVTRRAATLFICQCGEEYISYASHIVDGRQKSCGCLGVAGNGHRRNAKYNYAGSDKLRRAYYTMMGRCYLKSVKEYKWYGARGVRVCDEWKNNPQSFFDWAINNGFANNLSLDKDKLGTGMLYSPDTCCWITHKENMREKRNNVKLMYKGENITISAFMEILGCNRNFVEKRINEGMTSEQIEKSYLLYKKSGRKNPYFDKSELYL